MAAKTSGLKSHATRMTDAALASRFVLLKNRTKADQRELDVLAKEIKRRMG